MRSMYTHAYNTCITGGYTLWIISIWHGAVQRFKFDRFVTPAQEKWEYYIQRFETELALYNLFSGDATAEARKNLLLSKVGPEAFRILVDHHRPEAVTTKTYQLLKSTLQRHYQAGICILAERVTFASRYRKEGETVSQFVIALCAIAGNCSFGQSLEERLRDQLAIGINNDYWQRELFRIHTTNEATLQQVEASALVLEQAHNQQHKIQALGKDNTGTESGIRRVKGLQETAPHARGSMRNTSGFTPKELEEGRDCLRCGFPKHRTGEKCPAQGAICNSCGASNHFARVCMKSKRATVTHRGQRGLPRQRRVNAVAIDPDDEEYTDSVIDGDDSGEREVNTVQIRTLRGQAARLSVLLNGVRVQMLYDPGAARSVISEQIWKRIGSPYLSSADTLVAYTNVVVETLGETTIDVQALGKRKELPVTVVKQHDQPLFGVSIAARYKWKHHIYTIGGTASAVLRTLSEKPSTINGHKAVVHMKRVLFPGYFLHAHYLFQCGRPWNRRYIGLRTLYQSSVAASVSPSWTCLMLISKWKWRKYLIIATHLGYFQFKKLPFGVSFAPAIFQKAMDQILSGIPKTAAYIDDILVAGTSQEEHLKLLKEVLERLKQANNPLSRLPLRTTNISTTEQAGYSGALLNIRIGDLPISKKELQRLTRQDPLLSRVILYMERGWPNDRKLIPQEYMTFYEKRDSLSFEENILLWQGRIVIPKPLHDAVLATLHDGHPGIWAMRALARFDVWWPNIDEEVEMYVKKCSPCQQNRPREPESLLFAWNTPSEPWSRIHVDYAGPFEGKYWLVVIDAFSKWLEIKPMQVSTAAVTIKALREIFCRFGLPRVIVSDNGPQFIASEFKDFCTANNITHIRATPYHPKTNGLAERAVRTFKERFSATKMHRDDLDLTLQRFLISYRNTPHKSTGRSPAELLLGRRIRTRDLVWVGRPEGKGYESGCIMRKTGPLSYIVNVNGIERRKHADQLRKRMAESDVESEEAEDTPPKTTAETDPHNLEQLIHPHGSQPVYRRKNLDPVPQPPPSVQDPSVRQQGNFQPNAIHQPQQDQLGADERSEPESVSDQTVKEPGHELPKGQCRISQNPD
eukprot:Em0003g852a